MTTPQHKPSGDAHSPTGGGFDQTGPTAHVPADISSAPIEAEREGGLGNADDVEDIFRELQRGRGRERVDDANVKALIALAHERGDAQLELLLREWQSPCGEGAGSLPPTLPPP